MSFNKIPYDSAKLDALRIRLENHARIGEPIYYAIVVDDLEVIPRTADATLFATIEELIGPNTRYISVAEYIGNTRNRKTTCFVMDTGKAVDQNNLNGLDSPREDQQQYIERQVAYATLQREHANLQSEYNKLKQVSETLLTKCDELEERNSELVKLNDEKSQQSSILAFASDLVNRFAPQKTESPLAGTPSQNVHEAADATNDEGQVQVAISEVEYKNYSYFVEQFSKFDQTQKGLISKLIELLAEYPELIEEIFVTTYQKTQEHGKEKD
jgi:hypothetical protein